MNDGVCVRVHMYVFSLLRMHSHLIRQKQREALCAMKVTPLRIPEEAFGMHDLRQYHLWLNGTDCAI